MEIAATLPNGDTVEVTVDYTAPLPGGYHDPPEGPEINLTSGWLNGERELTKDELDAMAEDDATYEMLLMLAQEQDEARIATEEDAEERYAAEWERKNP